MTKKIPTLKKLLTAGTAALLIAGSTSGAMAFCFSNDSLSNTSMTAAQMGRNQFFQSMTNIVDSGCSKFGGHGGSREVKDCKELTGIMAETFEMLGKKINDDKYTGAAVRAAEDAAQEVYYFTTGLPVVGDAMDATVAITGAAKSTIKKSANWVGQEFDKLTSKRFKKTVGPDGTQCCSWKNKDCNPSGQEDGNVYFTLKYAGLSRVVRLGARDHMECTIDKNNAKGAVCRNYAYPHSPFRAHEETRRGMLIKSKHTGKCLEVGGGNKNNGANVNMWECHGGKNQRWAVYKNGTIRSEMNWKCLDVAIGAKKPGKNGANVTMYDCHGAHNQRWTTGRDEQLISRAAGKYNWCMEVGGWDKKDGANVNVWKCGKAQDNQVWWIMKK